MLPLGKLPPDLLARLLGRIPATDPRVVVGSTPGVDAAVLDMGDRYLIATTDPITFTGERIGWYAVHVNANDVAVMGGTPRWMLATVLLPPSGDESMVESIHQQMLDACAGLGVSLIGGHTEVAHGLDRPIVSATMLGEVAKGRLVTSAGARPGDRLLLTGGIGIEGTAILAMEARDALLSAGVAEAVIARAAEYLDAPGISIVAAARALCEVVRPHAMHDATEGGVATAVRELAEVSGVGLLINPDSLLLPETTAICDALHLDPLGLVASGCLIAAIAPEDEEVALRALADVGVRAAVCGEIQPLQAGLSLANERSGPLPTFARDELARHLEGNPTPNPSAS
jgi:hydrogenase expression/formation protein HypE